MSLLTEAMEQCVMLNKVAQSDGFGSYYTQWIEGVPFDAAITFDTSIQARTAEAQGVKSVYTVTVDRGMRLEYHDVFKRLSDGKVFRATSDGDDSYTPSSAGLNMRQVTAEEYAINGNT